MGWKAVRLWTLVSVLLAGLAGFSMLRVVGSPLWAAVAAAGTALLGVVVPLAIERLRKHARPAELPAVVRSTRLPTVAEALAAARKQGGDRWTRLGVHTAIPLPEYHDEALSPSLPRYVPRDADERVRAWLAGAAASGGFLLLVGDSAAGKTRMAVEALDQEPLRGWRFLHPTSAREVTALTTGRPGTVVWLDEIQNFLAGSDALTAATVDRLLDTDRVILVGTGWPDTVERFSAAPADPDRDLFKDARLILRRAHRQDVSATFSAAELARLEAIPDPRLHEAARAGPRVTEALAAVPDLIRRWRHGPDEFGVLVVTAATLCRRAGHPDTVPRRLLEAVTTALLSERQRPKARADWFANALAWAQQPVRGQSSLLWAVGTAPGATDGYQVADALVQDAAADGAPPNRALDAPLWTAIAEHADVAVVRAVLNALYSQNLPRREEKGIARTIWRRLAEAGDADAMNHFGLLVVASELIGEDVSDAERQESREWTRRAAELGHEGAMLSVAGEHSEAGRVEEALAGYARLVDARDETVRGIARYNRAVVLHDLGRPAEAEAAYRTAIEGEGWAAVYPFADLLRETGRTAEAVELYRRAADAGQEQAMACLGELAAEAGRLEEAEDWYRRALESGDVTASINLGALRHEAGAVDEAEQLWRRAAEDGWPEAMYNLGILCRDADRPAEAMRWWRQAAERDYVAAMLELGTHLYLAGDPEAEEWLRQAADQDDAGAMNNLAAVLADAGRMDEARTWWERAAGGGDADAALNLATLHERDGQREPAARWFRRVHELDPGLLGASGYEAAEAGRLDEAESRYRAGAELGDTTLMAMLGSLLHEQDRLEEAETWYRRAIERPEPIIKYQLGYLLWETGRQAEGLDWIRKAAEAGSPEAVEALAAIEGSGD
ncbi:tetratricopeptide repeat protein [Amycolatopsis sp. NPDC005003]